MRKKGGRVNMWGERYFSLRGPTLYYYLKATDSVIKIFIQIIIIIIFMIIFYRNRRVH